MKKVILSIALVTGIFATANIQATNSTIEQPIIETAINDDGFVDVKFEDLNEKVQEAVRGIAQENDLNVLQYNAEKQITKVVATSKEDQSQKTIYLDAEGKETTFEEPAQGEAVEQQQEGTETPSADNLYASQDDGFVNITFEDLNEKVQEAVRGIAQENDLNVLQYNAEKQITKVVATSKEDQSQKTIYLDAEGKETTFEEPAQGEAVEQQQEGTETPSADNLYASQDDGFVNITFEDLNEKVQEAVRGIAQENDLNVLQYNAEKQITKVVATSKEDQSQKTIYLDAEGKETTFEEPAQGEAVEQQQEGTETPSADNLYASQDDGFVNITFDNLNEKVQEAVRAVAKDYDLNVLQYNAEKQITKVEGTKKDDQSKKTFYFDAEGKETTLEEKTEEVQQEETMEQQPMLPSAESFDLSSSTTSDDGFVEVKLEDLNEKVQTVINALKETYDIDKVMYNAEKQITKVEVTNKTDQSKNKFYFDNEGVETTWDEPVEEVEKETKTEEVL